MSDTQPLILLSAYIFVDVYISSKRMSLSTFVQVCLLASLAVSSVPAGTSHSTSYTLASYQIQQICSYKQNKYGR